jgi:hypothetical protein
MATSSYVVPPIESVPHEPVSHVAPIGILPMGIFEATALRAALPGLAVAILTVLFGFAMGGVFGLNEDLIKDRLAGSATAVTATVYHGDPAAAEPVVAKSWEYMQRAHLHGGGIGTAAIGMILVMLLIGTAPRTIRVVSLALGAGALGYAVFWMGAGFLAPGLGSTGAAKESLRWLAVPSAGALLLGTTAVTYLCIRAWISSRTR